MKTNKTSTYCIKSIFEEINNGVLKDVNTLDKDKVYVVSVEFPETSSKETITSYGKTMLETFNRYGIKAIVLPFTGKNNITITELRKYIDKEDK